MINNDVKLSGTARVVKQWWVNSRLN